MKITRQTIVVFLVLIVACSLYRIFDNRPLGFAPQIAMALFGGMAVKNRVWAFALPVFSMFLSDLLYQVLYMNGLTNIRGFYDGQLINYILLASVVLVGMLFRKISLPNIFIGALAAPTWFFLISNFVVWIGGGGYVRPKTFSGLMQSYADGLPFYGGSLAATVAFSALFFGAHYLITRGNRKLAVA